MDQLRLLCGGPVLAVEHLPAKILRLCVAVLQGLPRNSNEVLHHPDHAVVPGRSGDDRGCGSRDEDQLSRIPLLLPILLPRGRLLNQEEDQDHEGNMVGEVGQSNAWHHAKPIQMQTPGMHKTGVLPSPICACQSLCWREEIRNRLKWVCNNN